ncbi:MAG TPA: hypothetical protein VE549_14370 [Myxococcaceae bacterium]|nr:hypothetical protein [Myxococcaceae bacterium]
MTGALGGVLMAAWLVVSAGFGEHGPIRPLELFGATFHGPDALGGGAVAAMPGVLLHLVVSAALGVPFAAVVPRDFPVAAGSVLGIGYALPTPCLIRLTS